jgi:hypothetical protein
MTLDIDFDNKKVFINDILIYAKKTNNTIVEDTTKKPNNIIVEDTTIETNVYPEIIDYNCMEGINNIFDNFKTYCESSTKKITNSINKTMNDINNKIIESSETIDTIIQKIKNI